MLDRRSVEKPVCKDVDGLFKQFGVGPMKASQLVARVDRANACPVDVRPVVYRSDVASEVNDLLAEHQRVVVSTPTMWTMPIVHIVVNRKLRDFDGRFRECRPSKAVVK